MSKENEILHFNKLAKEKERAWWGSKTYSGQYRKKVRAEMAKKYLGNTENKTILEIGVAAGDYTKVLAEEFITSRILATDISPAQIELARKIIKADNIKFRVDNCEKMNIENDSIDCIISNSILHHVDVDRCLKECLRVLQPGGKIFFTEPNMLNPEILIQKNIKFIGKLLDNSPDETAFVRWKLEKKINEIGFSNVEVVNFDFLHPLFPRPFTVFVDRLSRFIEKTPFLKEISGSLIIYAEKLK